MATVSPALNFLHTLSATAAGSQMLMPLNVSLLFSGGELMGQGEQGDTDLLSLDDVIAGKKPLTAKEVILAVIYGLICLAGLLGNGLVIVVVLRYASMKTATNIYILNLSIADLLFLVGLPLIMTTALARGWVFGRLLCKTYMVLQCVNTFTGSLTLAVLSYDRYLAVCHPVTSRRYRTTRYAVIAVLVTWLVSAVAIFPIVHYANVVSTSNVSVTATCTTTWLRTHGAIFVSYNFAFSFFVPVLLICIFYTLLIVRLRAIRRRTANIRGTNQGGVQDGVGVGGGMGSGRMLPTRRRITRMVTLIIAVYIVCWLPYWSFQLYIIASGHFVLPDWVVDLIKASTVLSYANSMINPILYAFTNELFRQSFVSAFRCVPEAMGHGVGGMASGREGREGETGLVRSKNTSFEPMVSLHRSSACFANGTAIALEIFAPSDVSCCDDARKGLVPRRISLHAHTSAVPRRTSLGVSDVAGVRRTSLGPPPTHYDIIGNYSPFKPAVPGVPMNNCK